jgi:cytochrome c biogenesis protein CcdA/thiol-disulfide isomerase/thioredoxin
VLVLIAVGFAAGLVTALSPCVLPVLPILFAGGASGGRRRPYAIVAGLVLSFSAFTLAGVWLLDVLGLPKDLLRDLALALLFVVAASLLVPRLGELLERPLLRLTRRPAGDLGGGLVLGLSLGLVFVPCAGPVLAAVTVVAASRDLGADVVALTVAYAAGAAVPMLLVAAGGRWAAGMRAVRAHSLGVRRALGAVVGLTALAIALGADSRFQTSVPGYTEALQDRIERSSAADRELDELTGRTGHVEESTLRDFGEAPEFAGIARWLNTPGGRALSLEGLRGKVVLIDFWTYSCVNCLRTLPYLRGWDEAYHDKGLQIVGVHTPEFAFEHDEDNVRGAVDRLELDYPVALDNDYGTWDAYGNRYWPAKYLIDRRGHVRFAHFGEGAYAETERVIRLLLAESPQAELVSARIRGANPSRQATPETYLGYLRIANVTNFSIAQDREATYLLPKSLATDHLALGGRWRVENERAVAGRGARLRLRFRAREVNLVLGGKGRVTVLLDGKRVRVVSVTGSRLYELLHLPAFREGTLELRFTADVAGYAFTFG